MPDVRTKINAASLPEGKTFPARPANQIIPPTFYSMPGRPYMSKDDRLAASQQGLSATEAYEELHARRERDREKSHAAWSAGPRTNDARVWKPGIGWLPFGTSLEPTEYHRELDERSGCLSYMPCKKVVCDTTHVDLDGKVMRVAMKNKVADPPADGIKVLGYPDQAKRDQALSAARARAAREAAANVIETAPAPKLLTGTDIDAVIEDWEGMAEYPHRASTAPHKRGSRRGTLALVRANPFPTNGIVP